MDTAPKDGTMLTLLVDYSGESNGHPLFDATTAWTVGFNNFDHDGDDAWKFAGWCWSHDHFTEGTGKPIGWLPFLPPPNGAKMREALQQAAEWFQQYADGHTAKGDTDKAARNQTRADACRVALRDGLGR